MSTENLNTTSTQIVLPGAALKQAREAKGLTVEEMAAISNLTKQVIRGIESDSYDDLAGLSFVRGYLKLYAKKLGVDETEILEPFDAWKRERAGEGHPEHSARGFDSHTTKAGTRVSSRTVGAIGGGILVVLLATGTYISVQDSSQTTPVAVEPPIPNSLSVESQPEGTLPGGEVVGGLIQSDAETAISESAQVVESEIATDSEGLNTPATDANSTADAIPATPVEEPVAEIPAVETPVAEAQVPEAPEVAAPTPPPAPPKPPTPVPAQVAPKPPVSPPVQTVTLPEPPAVSAPVIEDNAPSPRQPRASRVLAEAENLQPAAPEPAEARVDNRDQDAGLRVLSETVTGSIREQEQLGAPGRLQMRFTGESWVEVRDAQGRLILADLMRADREVSLDTWGPIEVLVGAVDASSVVFNGETLDLSNRAFQNVARVTLGAPRN